MILRNLLCKPVECVIVRDVAISARLQECDFRVAEIAHCAGAVLLGR